MKKSLTFQHGGELHRVYQYQLLKQVQSVEITLIRTTTFMLTYKRTLSQAYQPLKHVLSKQESIEVVFFISFSNYHFAERKTKNMKFIFLLKFCNEISEPVPQIQAKYLTLITCKSFPLCEFVLFANNINEDCFYGKNFMIGPLSLREIF